MSDHPRAPIYRRAFDLSQWLLGRLGEQPDTLSRDAGRLVLQLLDLIVLALKDRDRLERLERADETLIRLRQRLRLLGALGRLDERAMLHGLALCDDLGRQLGGWLNRLLGPE
jgi:hypothetical protein